MNTLTWVLFATQFVTLGSLFMVLPSFRRGQFFGVTVPVDFALTEQGRSILRRYRLLLLTAFALCIVAGAAGVELGHLGTSPVAMIAALLASLLLWSRAYKDAAVFRTAVPIVRSADLRPADLPFPWMQAASIVPLAIVAAVLSVNWSRLPESFPRRFGIDGHAAAFLVARTFGSVFGPVLCGVIFYSLLLGLAVGMQRSRKIENAYACMVLPAASWMLTLLFSAISSIPLAIANRMPTTHILFAIAIISGGGGLLIAGMVVATAMRMRNTLTPYGDTSDAGWRAGGIIYYNPEDPALWVDKRLGFGRTLNFARPQSWLILGLLLGVVALSVSVVSLR